MYRGYKFIIAHIAIRIPYFVSRSEGWTVLDGLVGNELEILEGDAPWFEMQQSIARRLWASHLAGYFAGFNDT